MTDVRELASFGYRVDLHQRVHQGQYHLLAVGERRDSFRKFVNALTENISERVAIRDWPAVLGVVLLSTPFDLAVVTILPPLPKNGATRILA